MSKEIVLEAAARPESGSGPAGRLRREGRVPAVVYGHGVTPKPVSVDARALRAALHTDAGLNALITLNVEGETHLAMVREPQINPIRSSLNHVDFLIVNRNEEIAAEVPLTIVGEAEGVKRGGGVLEHHLFALHVKATPDKIPTHLDIDISALGVGDSLHVRDIALPAGVSTDLDPETAVLMVDVPRVVAAATPAEGEVVEGEAVAAETPAAEAPAEG